MNFVPEFKLECLKILVWIRIGNINDFKAQ